MKKLKTEEKNKNVSKEIEKKISKKVFINLVIAIVIMIYFCAMSFVYTNIVHDEIVNVVKIATLVFLALSIVLIELAYKKESKILTMYAFEVLALAIHSLTTVHITKLYDFDFKSYILASSYAFSIYYVLKTIILNTKARKDYLKSLSDIPEIIQKEEPSKKEASKKQTEDLEEQEPKKVIKATVKHEVVHEIEEVEHKENDDKISKIAKIRAKIERLSKLEERKKENPKQEQEQEKEEEKKENNIQETKEQVKEKIQEVEEAPKPKKRGRPKKVVSEVKEVEEAPKPKKRGRPKKEVKVND